MEISDNTTLQEILVRTAKRLGAKFALADSGGAKVTWADALAKTVFLTGRLEPVWRGQEKVGILVPPSVGGTLVNWAALMMGKVPVNLNYTLSKEGIASCVEQCGLTDVVVSGKLMKRLKLELPVRVHVLEDLVEKPRLMEKLRAGFLSKLCSPDGLLKRCGGHATGPDDLATIIFSSGSTGDPKGVMLTHRNIISNALQVGSVYSFLENDCMLGVLPFFHSFGFMATIAGPAVYGFGVASHFNPMEAKVVGPLAAEHGVTILISTPTFLQFYLRGIDAEQLRTMRLVVVGAEKLPDRVADAFEKKFGMRPYEAYGCSECSPGVTMNGPDAVRLGSIGRPIPGMEVKVVDPSTGNEMATGREGILKVKGPNVMRGYLNQPGKTAEVLKDGWYETGDVVRIDDDGFLWITGRLSRFSKIGGEMVPHGTVEETLHELAGITEQAFAVTGVPDDRKGERLMVVHTAGDDVLETVLAKLGDSELPNLWKPKRAQFVAVEALPYLGSGKLDLKGLQQMAADLG